MKIKFVCKTDEEKEAAKHFLSWLSEQGEQDYWDWMEVRESESDGPITILRFEYANTEDEAACEIGRLDEL